MLAFLQNKKIVIILWLFILIGIVFRFYNLNWGAPYYFHPDERNIASSITQLQFPSQMNPHFFAYGSLPIYLIYFSDVAFNYVSNCSVTNHTLFASCHTTTITAVLFEQAIIGLRIVAATLSVLLIPLLYLIGKKLKNETTGIVLAFFALTSIGFIQYSHFGTYEIFLTFFTALLFLLSLHLLQKQTKTMLFFVSITSGILLSSKITNLALVPIPLGIFLYHFIKAWRAHTGYKVKLGELGKALLAVFVYVSLVFYVFFFTNPYTFFDYSSFHNSMTYESNVALGTEPVFYTGEFFNTLPIMYQVQHVLPFLLTPFLLLFLLPALIYVLIKSVKPWNKNYLLLFLFLGLTFFLQAFFFVKWTRYMVPSLSFFYCILAIFITEAVHYLHAITPHKQYKRLIMSSVGLGGCISLVYAFAFFITVYSDTDTRVASEQFAKRTIPGKAPVISEVYDLGITAFNADFSDITLFNFYDLDNQSPLSSPTILATELQTTDYIILPSQRILKVRLQRPKKFPNGNTFYKQLLAGKLGFQKIYETPCDIWCMITYTGNPVFSYEETANVFDRPEVFIFKKVK